MKGSGLMTNNQNKLFDSLEAARCELLEHHEERMNLLNSFIDELDAAIAETKEISKQLDEMLKENEN
jgi:hypothetical protein